MKAVQKGFTLIELMIVVAIIAILAAVAIPAYRDYTTRAQVSEMFLIASACKNNVAEYYADRAAFPTNGQDVGCNDGNPSTEGTLLSEAADIIGNDGEVGINAKVGGALATKLGANRTLALVPSSDAANLNTVIAPNGTDPIAQWVCSPIGSGNLTTILPKYLPGQCRD